MPDETENPDANPHEENSTILAPITEPETPITDVITLQSEIQVFINELGDWGKSLCGKLLSNLQLTDEDFASSYEIFKEDYGLKPIATRIPLTVDFSTTTSIGYKENLKLEKIRNIEGVNALVENQVLDFGPNITVFFGRNGSGKSGYTRLCKIAFFSRLQEHLIQNIHLETGHKATTAEFVFSSNGSEYSKTYPLDKDRPEFKQIAVFDNKCASVHLNSRNGFEFRPAGLNLFGGLISAFRTLEAKLQSDIDTKGATFDYPGLFEGNSTIKALLQNINHTSDITTLRNEATYSAQDVEDKSRKQTELDGLRLTVLDKEKQLRLGNQLLTVFNGVVTNITRLNTYFTSETFTKINAAISDLATKTQIANAQEPQNLHLEGLQEVGSVEWKNFIKAAGEFAIKQSEHYPIELDNCILCNQTLSSEASILIHNYWHYLKSEAEQQLKVAQETIAQIKRVYTNLSFEQIPVGSVSEQWLTDNNPELLIAIRQSLTSLHSLKDQILTAIDGNGQIEISVQQIDVQPFNEIIARITETITSTESNTPNPRIQQLYDDIVLLNHKEKLTQQIDNIEVYINNLKWANLATTAKSNLRSRWITETEKRLSDTYFNQAYYDEFENECRELDGDFGIRIEHTGTLGSSFRQLKLSNNQPSDVLSEGEQKVIAIADFLVEMKMSGVNKGLIFDDPVTSLDSDRKKQIAERLVKESRHKQIIIFTHDLVFYNLLFNASKQFLEGVDQCFYHHSVVKENQNSIGKIIPNFTPAHQVLYKDARKSKEFLEKSKITTAQEQLDNIKSGYSALRTTYEHLISNVIVGSVVQRFDPLIRVGRLREMKYDKNLVEQVVIQHGEISDFIEGHLPAAETGIIPTPNMLEEKITTFEALKQQFSDLQ